MKSYRNKVRTKKSQTGGRKLDYLLIVVSVAVLAFVGSFAIKYSVGESSPQVKQRSFLRFQVLNGCGVSGAAAKFSRHLRELSTDEIVIDVIDEGNFESFDQDKTLLIVRDASTAEAEAVTILMGLADDQVVRRELSDNFLDIDFTVVLGDDYTSMLGPDTLSNQT